MRNAAHEAGSATKPRYWAFISHSSIDKPIARRIARALAREIVPRKFRGLVRSPRPRFESIFLDEKSIPAAPSLGAALEAALDDSHFLIVLCSPNAAASIHVNDEIAYFVGLGREDRIIGVIVSGTANATDVGQSDREAFPPAFRLERTTDRQLSSRPKPLGARPITANIADGSRQLFGRAIHMLVAGMLGISQDELRTLRSRRRLLQAASAIAVAASLVGGAFLVWDGYYRPVQHSYRDFVRQWGVWKGIDRISPNEAKHRERIEIVTRGRYGNPVSARKLDGHGRCSTEGFKSILGNSLRVECSGARACEASFKYDGSGALTEERLRDQIGRPMETLTYASSEVATFVEAGFGCSRTKSGVQYVRFTRTPSGPSAGFDAQLEFLDQKRNPRVNDVGAAGIAFEWDGRRLMRVTRLDGKGTATRGNDGVAIVAMSYDQRGYVTSERYLAPDGQPTTDKNGMSELKLVHNVHGQIIERRYVGIDGDAAFDASGRAGQRFVRDSWGKAIETTALDGDGRPTVSKEGYASDKTIFDDHGVGIEERYYDAAGQPATDADGASGYRFRHGALGFVVESMAIGADDKPVLLKNGTAGYRLALDEFGDKVLLETLLDTSGQPTTGNDGYVHRANEFDARGRRIAETYLGHDMQPVPNAEKGIAMQQLELDDNGNVLSRSSFNRRGEPVADSDGVATRRTSYDEFGHEAQRLYFGPGGDPIVDSQGVAGLSYLNDTHDNTLRREYLGPDRKITLGTDGTASWTATFDNVQRRLSSHVFDENGQPTLRADGTHGIRMTYDWRGNQTGERYYDLQNRPVANTDGVAGYRAVFDNVGNRTEVTYLATDSSPVRHKNGYAIVRETFDAHGNATSKSYFDIDGSRVADKNGIARFEFDNDRLGRVVLERHLDTAGKPTADSSGIAAFRKSYDSYGNVTETVYLGVDGKPKNNGDGFAIVRNTFDPAGRTREIAYLDAEGNSVAAKSTGIWVHRYVRDDRGTELQHSFHTPDGQPTTTRFGNSVNRSTVDDRGLTTRREYLGLSGERVAFKITELGDTVSAWEKTYDQWGRETEVQYFDTADRPTANAAGAHRIVYLRDKYGVETGQKRYRVDGSELVAPAPSP